MVNYCKERGVYFYTHDVNEYLTTKQYKDYLAGKSRWVRDVFCHLLKEMELPIDYVKKMLDRIILEHVYKYLTYTTDIANFIKKYYKKSMALYGEVKVVPNIFSNYINLLYLFDEYENTHYNELLNKHNNKSWLYFENDTFVVRPLLTKEEFHAEAEAQNNCVERMYMGKVKDGETHVVVVRRKNDPDHSYITCEVNNRGNIIQYRMRFNHRPTSEKDLSFETLYQEHLTNSIYAE